MEDFDGILERQDTKDRMPLGWFLLFVGLIVWGLFYSFVHVPIGSWSQYTEYNEQAVETTKAP